MRIPICKAEHSRRATAWRPRGGCQRDLCADLLERPRPDWPAREAALRDTTPWVTVVGVAKDVKQGGVDRATGTELYFLLEHLPQVFPALQALNSIAVSYGTEP